MLLTIEGRSPLLLDKQETTMMTKTRLTAFALAVAALTSATLTATEASAQRLANPHYVPQHAARGPSMNVRKAQGEHTDDLRWNFKLSR
jgi:hypothetical protein